MSILAIGGAGFIGRRLIPILASAGHEVTCMDIDVASATAAFSELSDKVTVVRGDVTQFDDVIGAMQESKAERVVNLSYFIGELAPHVAFKLDIQGMDNCFEAARRLGVKHTVFASSLAVSGPQSNFGERLVTETDVRHGETQYAANKIYNEWQALDYRRAYDMTITCIRPANVTGPDKKFGSIDHVNCMCQPARAIWLSSHIRMRCDVSSTWKIWRRSLQEFCSQTNPNMRPITPAGRQSAWGSWRRWFANSYRMPTFASVQNRAGARSPAIS